MTELEALKKILEKISFPVATEIADRLIGTTDHVHTDQCPTWNGYPEFSPAHCPGEKS